MNLSFALRHYGRIIQHFTANRAAEVLALQAAPFLGAVLAGIGSGWLDFARLVLLLTASLALTAHIFVLNDWAGQRCDVNDPRRAPQVFGQHGIGNGEVLALAAALLLVALAALALLGTQTTLIGVTIAVLSVSYSCSPFFGKGKPIWGSLFHVIGGVLHFLLGYSVVSLLDARGFAISLFFGLVFAAGHLNQEVRDYDGDLANAISTNAVFFGRRTVFFGSLILFTVAYVTLAGLAAIGMLPRALLWCLLLVPAHVAWSLQAVRKGLSFDAACWMQRRYRLFFAVVGLAMLLTAHPLQSNLPVPDSPIARLVRSATRGSR